MASPMLVTLADWKPVHRNGFRGFASVRIGAHLIIHGVTIHLRNGRLWAEFPNRPVLSKDGDVVRDKDGRIQHRPVISWADQPTARAYSDAVIAAIERAHPGATAV